MVRKNIRNNLKAWIDMKNGFGIKFDYSSPKNIKNSRIVTSVVFTFSCIEIDWFNLISYHFLSIHLQTKTNLGQNIASFSRVMIKQKDPNTIWYLYSSPWINDYLMFLILNTSLEAFRHALFCLKTQYGQKGKWNFQNVHFRSI